jgi:hypothetical protein
VNAKKGFFGLFNTPLGIKNCSASGDGISEIGQGVDDACEFPLGRICNQVRCSRGQDASPKCGEEEGDCEVYPLVWR